MAVDKSDAKSWRTIDLGSNVEVSIVKEALKVYAASVKRSLAREVHGSEIYLLRSRHLDSVLDIERRIL